MRPLAWARVMPVFLLLTQACSEPVRPDAVANEPPPQPARRDASIAAPSLVPDAAPAPVPSADAIGAPAVDASAAPDVGASSDVHSTAPATPSSAGIGARCARTADCRAGLSCEGNVNGAGLHCATEGMVFVPAGSFVMGCNSCASQTPDAIKNNVPSRTVTLTKAYELDKTEVTQKAYATCVAAGKCRVPVHPHVGAATPPIANSTEPSPDWNPSMKPQHPVRGVFWGMARDYCQFAGKRLPTEAEWERAARDPDGKWPFPWGTAPRASGLPAHRAVGLDPGNASHFGALDMLDNATEWTGDSYHQNWYQDAVKKGANTDPVAPPYNGQRATRVPPNVWSRHGLFEDPAKFDDPVNWWKKRQWLPELGFRCARSLP